MTTLIIDPNGECISLESEPDSSFDEWPHIGHSGFLTIVPSGVPGGFRLPYASVARTFPLKKTAKPDVFSILLRKIPNVPSLPNQLSTGDPFFWDPAAEGYTGSVEVSSEDTEVFFRVPVNNLNMKANVRFVNPQDMGTWVISGRVSG